jgi:hypothetical protein
MTTAIKEGTVAELPIAQAIAIGAAPDVAGMAVPAGMTIVDLEIGSSGTYVFTGSPVQVAKLQGGGQQLDGLYLHSIQIGTDLEIHHFKDAAKVVQLLDSNASLARRLCLTSHVPPLVHTDGLYYTVTLPTPASLDSLQMELNGFPPGVLRIAPSSPLAGKIHPGHSVVQIQIPGRPVVNARTPGFTATRVKDELSSAAHVPGIKMAFKEVLVHVKLEKGSNAPFDDCLIL